MKKISLLFTALSIAVYFFLTSFGGSLRYPGGSPAGYTGSPGDGKDCAQCHGGSSSFVENWISSNIPESGYIPGETYDIKVTVSGSGDKGFEVSPQNFAGDQLGELIAGPQTELKGGTKYVTQSNSSSSNPKIWNFQWVAPASGTGQIVFYGAFTVNKPVTKLSNYSIMENTGVSIRENDQIDFSLYPNPATERINIELERFTDTFILDIIDLGGRVIQHYRVNSGGSDYSFDVSGIEPGLYFARIKSEQKQSSIRLVIK